jgi:predicted N-acetyltransferase YhbS
LRGDVLENINLKVREAMLDDYKSIAEISRSDLGYLCEDNLVKTKLSLIDNRRECVFVAEYENKVIGYVHVEKYDTLYSETLVNILGLAVSIEKRRIGAGHLLMSKAEEWAKLIGAVAVRLNSGSLRASAHEFYRTIGYNLEKEQIRFLKIL